MVVKRKQPFDCLPDEMVFLPKFFRCKRLKVLSNDLLVLQRVSKEVVAESVWQEKKNKPTLYLKRCADAGNAEARYPIGIVISLSPNFM
ncbi:hypothetical protein AMTR_s00072p00099580 [Amborella trichopoda]|uniref:Uncharacterized protein n=1 Tax=Amborella trichopoda TaxID=13333 RepID=W1NUS8_AMBTC|nr:hypothetical protein AMTR_s00072p00099580 [Amborella trichopoda]